MVKMILPVNLSTLLKALKLINNLWQVKTDCVCLKGFKTDSFWWKPRLVTFGINLSI